jgi:hypothetical protein
MGTPRNGTIGERIMLELLIALGVAVAGLFGIGKYAQTQKRKVKRLEKEIEVAEKIGRFHGRKDVLESDPDHRERVREFYTRENNGGGDNTS